ncbi:MAG: putative transcriptional regulator [Lentisphaeria bacterium]|jgi:predicted transcriptional regulator
MDAVNFQSLNMVRDELVATIEDSAQHLERFVSAQGDGTSLQSSIDGITQIVGILKLIQLNGAELLARELLITAQEISPGNSGRRFEKRLEVVSSSFFVLTRYLEFIQETERRAPVLLIPQINELRKLRSEPALPESHFFNLNLAKNPKLPEVDPLSLAGQPFKTVVRRLRHMYQFGLLGFMKEHQTKNSVAMMRRALNRLRRFTPNDQPLALLWWLGNCALDVIVSKNMAVIETRKLLFGRIDRIIRQVEKSGEAAFAAQTPKGLVKELVYLVALSAADSSDANLVRSNYGVERFPFTDRDLSDERDLLNGPSAHTVSSLAHVLTSELQNTKKVLEGASQSSVQKIDDIEGFIATLQKISEILSIVGLVSASNILKAELKRIELWRDKAEVLNQEEMQDVANTLLYLESVVSSIETTKLSDEKLELANKLAQQEVIASGELAEAKRIVLSECEAGISLTKRALSSFSESDFDTGHILNIGKTLNTVRGGMLMMNNMRAAQVLRRCSQFVDEVLTDSDQPPALKETLETFADAIIAIEYYLDSATTRLKMDDSVLQIAEVSLEALGYAVDLEE